MKSALVTGGGGFVGTAIVRNLLQRGCRVTVAGRHRYPHIESCGVQCLVGDIADEHFTRSICKGVDTVFHTAAKAGIWGPWKEYARINVEGTKNIISACLKNDVARLVYTSTPSVVFNNRNIQGGDERLPYPAHYLCNYAKSKVLAEKKVLSANSDALLTCAIRPHLVWGPGDPHLIPRLLERGKARQLRIIGDGNNLVDITYIDNVAHAHILAAESLGKNGKAAGKAYFIGQERPVNLWAWVNELFGDLDIPPVTRKVNKSAAYLAGLSCEIWYFLFSLETEPRMTRFLAGQLGNSHFFSHENAKQDLGYQPIISLEEGRVRLLEWLGQL